ncbi:M81 family metallopeptidase [Lentzea sp. E54]|uniref:M81 family metallopeptidase n=1 Tax=Lentzea xerophila TaxID=3435883 RepID=UPI003DA56F5D
MTDGTTRILVAGFQHETNTFAPTPASYGNFANGEGFPALRRGDGVLELEPVNLPVGGFLGQARARGWAVLPVIWAAAGPSGPVTTATFERIAGEIVDAVRLSRPDAVYLDLHGAMVTEHHDDGEGELLARVRAAAGPGVPVVASLDLHANMSARMFDAADALVCYRTYPHVDMAATGARAAGLLARLLDGERLRLAWRRVPFLIPINAGCTELEPARSVYGGLESLGGDRTTVSFAAGFPAADIPDCGPVVWAYGTGPAEEIVDRLYGEVTQDEAKWRIALLDPADAVAAGLAADGAEGAGPVVVADTQDNPGAGGSSRTTGLLRALLAAGSDEPGALGLITDPEAAATATAAGIGATVDLAIGGDPAVPGDEPVRGRFVVEALSDGRCRFDGPMLHGTEVDLGPSTCLRSGSVRVAVTTGRSQVFDRNLFRMVGIVPEDQRLLVVKSSVHFRGDFEPIARKILVARSPGLVAADPADLAWQRLPKSVRVTPGGGAP